MAKYRFLSHNLSRNTPSYGNSSRLTVSAGKSLVKGDSCNTFSFSMDNHLGTHIDGPRHFYGKGDDINMFDAGSFVFERPFVLNCFKKAGGFVTKNDLLKVNKECDLLILNTGFSKKRKTKDYSYNNPGISIEAAEYIAAKFKLLKAVGIDSVSVSSYSDRPAGRKVHRILLSKRNKNRKPLMLIEDMDLSKSLKGLKRVFAFPLIISGLDSLPSTVVGEFK
ncbi:MAG: cyclase family protein [Candidatus Margulisiibacteriota bacterium]